MSIESNSSQSDRIQKLMKAGNFADEAAVVTAALDLLERKQRLHALIQEGLDDIKAGRFVEMDEAMRSIRARLTELRDQQAVEIPA